MGDVALAVALAAVGAAVTSHGADVVGTAIADWHSFDLWFQSDAPRLFDNLTRRQSDHYRSNVHPLFSLVGYGSVYLLRRLLRLDPWTAVHAFEALVAAGWAATMYLLLRLAGHRRLDGVVLTLLGLGSAAAVLWLTVPESYGLGSLTLMLPLVILAAGAIRPLPIGWWVLGSAASLSITVTNWMSGLAAALRALGWRRAAVASAAAVVVVTAAWSWSTACLPSTEFFVSHEEQSYLRVPTPARIARVVGTMAVHSIVIPRIGRAFDSPHWLSAQRSWPGSGGPLAAAATIAWVALFGLGLREAGRRWRTDPLVFVTLACLAGQLALHMVYGEETLLYAMHWLPLLILVAGLALLGPARPWALALAIVTLVSGSANNLLRLDSIARMFRTPRQDVQDQMARRPGDPWPRGEAHVILSTPGSAADAKAYLEPGGSFSPRAASFGIALWVRDSAGGLRTTSDAIPLDELRQRFDTGSTLPPPVVVETPWYTAGWSYDGLWRLRIRPTRGARVEVVLRSVGPAGGPVRRLQWREGRLQVNDAWSLQPDFAPAAVILGDERDPGWVDATADEQTWNNQEGWGYARIPLPSDTASSLTVSEGAGQRPSTLPTGALARASAAGPGLRSQPPRAGRTPPDGHRRRREPRSADPLNTATPWQRTGAYEIVALLRAGQVARARALSELMIRQDYYGGFGAEADAPGLGIWALAEVAAALSDSAYDHRAWIAIDRKAAEIERFLETRDTIRAKVPNSIVPGYRSRPDIDIVAAPPRNGLIVGRMDHQYPLLYVNAVSYLGLQEAASLAQRVGERTRAEALRRRAGALRQAWLRAYEGEERLNSRTIATALWPTGVIDTGDGRARLLKVLAENRASLWNSRGQPREWPVWTYFDIAEAHQWLPLGRPDTAWSTLRWYWHHQTSPGSTPGGRTRRKGTATACGGTCAAGSIRRWSRRTTGPARRSSSCSSTCSPCQCPVGKVPPSSSAPGCRAAGLRTRSAFADFAFWAARWTGPGTGAGSARG